MIKEFKEFVLRGNVVDLAVGVVIGAAFGAIITSLVNDLFTPLISHLSVPDLSKAFIDFNHDGQLSSGDISYGKVVNAIVSFVLIAAVVFFFVVKPLNKLMGREKTKPEPEMHECPHCLTSIRVGASVCPACTREVG
jgi:large conductance mechanosensitive channel